MSLKLGLEVEFFVTKGGKLVDASEAGVPTDGCTLIAEARGKPYTNSFEAVASVRAEIERMTVQLRENKNLPDFSNWVERDAHVKALQEAALRRGTVKKGIAWHNLHSLETSDKNETHLSAGLHISFTRERVFNYSTQSGASTIPQVLRYNEMFDYSRLFFEIEKEFGVDIDSSERVRGFYELKSDGRIEYRSLPATLIHKKDFSARLNKVISSV